MPWSIINGYVVTLYFKKNVVHLISTLQNQELILSSKCLFCKQVEKSFLACHFFLIRNSENSSLNLVVSLLSRKICCKRFNRKFFSKETNNCSLKCNFKYKIKTKINKHLYCIYSYKWKYRMNHRPSKIRGKKN